MTPTSPDPHSNQLWGIRLKTQATALWCHCEMSDSEHGSFSTELSLAVAFQGIIQGLLLLAVVVF